MKLFLAGNRTETVVSAPSGTITHKVRSFVLEQGRLAAGQDMHGIYLPVMVGLWNDFTGFRSSRPTLRVVEDSLELVGFENDGISRWDSELQALSTKLFAELLVSGVEALHDVDQLARRLDMPRTLQLAHSS